MNRRDCLKCLAAAGLGTSPAGAGPEASAPKLTPPGEIERQLRHARPMLGGLIPTDLKDRLGATHYAGKYHLTQEPFLLEGCRALLRLGMRVAKLWLDAGLPGYGYNSQWNLSPTARLADVARHPYFVQALAMPFSTFVLEIGRLTPTRKGVVDPDCDYAEDERQLYELAAHLFKTYADRQVTFILQHWEGDWLLRGKGGQRWEPGGPPDALDRCAGFTRWLAARQHGVSRARAESGASACRVYHAAEVNRVWDLVRDVPTVTSHVLPHVAVDMVSWSSYDGMQSPVRIWQGLELIRHYVRPSPVFGKPVVYIGEIGRPENGETQQDIVTWWDQAMGVFFAQKVPYVLHWELYCNEPREAKTPEPAVCAADQLRGFWLIRPDRSLSYSGKYLRALLEHAGGVLPRDAQIT